MEKIILENITDEKTQIEEKKEENENIKEVFMEKLEAKLVEKEDPVQEEEEQADLKADDVVVSDKVKRIEIVRQIKKLCDKSGLPVPKGYTKMKKEQLKIELARLMNESIQKIELPPSTENTETEPEQSKKEDMIVNSLYRFGLLAMDTIEGTSKLKSVKEYTGGVIIDKWSYKFKHDENLANELKECLREIYAENDWLAEYMDCWSRLYLILGMSLMSSIKVDNGMKEKSTIII